MVSDVSLVSLSLLTTPLGSEAHGETLPAVRVTAKSRAMLEALIRVISPFVPGAGVVVLSPFLSSLIVLSRPLSGGWEDMLSGVVPIRGISFNGWLV